MKILIVILFCVVTLNGLKAQSIDDNISALHASQQELTQAINDKLQLRIQLINAQNQINNQAKIIQEQNDEIKKLKASN